MRIEAECSLEAEDSGTASAGLSMTIGLEVDPCVTVVVGVSEDLES